MSIRSLIPFGFERSTEPFREFRRDLEKLEWFFHNFWKGTSFVPGIKEGSLLPTVDITDSDKEIQIMADLPGSEEKDITIEINNNIFTLRGGKEEEKEEKGDNYYLSERSRGYFNRSFQLPAEVDENKAEAVLQNGTLKVILPKLAEEKSQKKRIEIKRK